MIITVRPARSGDAAVIAGFNAALARETESLTLDTARLMAGVEGLLANPDRGFYLVAEAEGAIAGQLMITYEWSDWRNGNFWWLQSVYVEPAFRSKGVFRGLYEDVQERARHAGNCCGLRLYVEESNLRAQQVYLRLGMQPAHYRFMEVDFVIRRP